MMCAKTCYMYLGTSCGKEMIRKDNLVAKTNRFVANRPNNIVELPPAEDKAP